MYSSAAVDSQHNMNLWPPSIREQASITLGKEDASYLLNRLRQPVTFDPGGDCLGAPPAPVRFKNLCFKKLCWILR